MLLVKSPASAGFFIFMLLINRSLNINLSFLQKNIRKVDFLLDLRPFKLSFKPLYWY